MADFSFSSIIILRGETPLQTIKIKKRGNETMKNEELVKLLNAFVSDVTENLDKLNDVYLKYEDSDYAHDIDCASYEMRTILRELEDLAWSIENEDE